MPDRNFPKFKNPPVTEVVFGLVFAPPPAFQTPHIGLLWDQYKKEFPKTQETDPLFEPSGISLGPWLLPRIWFINEDDSRVIQIQKDRFHYNWRKREDAYPNFDTVFPEFMNRLNVFLNFLRSEDLGVLTIKKLEVTYVNHIPTGEGWSLEEGIGGLFPGLEWHGEGKRFLPLPQNFRLHFGYPFPEKKGDLRVTINTGRRGVDGKTIIVLEMSASGNPNDSSETGLKDWFNLAHEWIVFGFEDITSENIQKNFWGKK